MSNNIKDMTDGDIIDNAESLYKAIYVDECYNKRAVELLSELVIELENRGYEVIENEKTIEINKYEEV